MRILMYHDIVPGGPDDVHSVARKRFAEQMQWLAQAGYRVTTAEDWVARRGPGVCLPTGTVAVTFDDGYEDNYTQAWPILMEHGWPATIYLVTGALGKASAWRSGVLSRARMLSEDQVVEMATYGIAFGSHSVTHRPLTQLGDRAEVSRELVSSKKVLEELLGREIAGLSYPYSAMPPGIARCARAAGYKLGLTYQPRYVGAPGGNVYKLRRIGILASDTLDDFSRKVRSTIPLRVGWCMRRLKQAIRVAARLGR